MTHAYVRFLGISILTCGIATQAVAQDQELEDFGDVMQYALPLTALGSTWLKGDPEGRRQFFYSYGTAMGTTTALKGLYGKLRPESTSRTSYPSGHTTSVVAAAAFLDQRYGHGWGIPAYVAAALTGYSRIDSSNHFADDVLAGTSIGLMSNWYWTTPYPGRVQVLPLVGEDRLGVSLQLNPTARQAPLDSQGSRPKARYTMVQGAAYLKKNTVNIPGTSSDAVALSRFALIDDPILHSVAELQWFLGGRHSLQFGLAPFEARDVENRDEALSFNGVDFPTTSVVRSSWRMTDLSGGYVYRAINQRHWKVDAGVGLTIMRTVVRFADADVPQLRNTRSRDISLAPHGNFSVGYFFNPRWSLQSTLTYGESSNLRFHYTRGFLQYRLNKQWDLALGYGRYFRDLQSSKLNNETHYNITSLMLSHTFY